MVTLDDIRRVSQEKRYTDRKLSIALAVLPPILGIGIIIFVLMGVFAYFWAVAPHMPVSYTYTITNEGGRLYQTNIPNSLIKSQSLQMMAPFIGGIFIIGIVFVIIVFIIEIYVMHRWLDARNKHFTRSIEFFKLVSEYVDNKAPEDAKEYVKEFKGSVDTLASWRRGEIGSIAWAILAAIFTLGVYLLTLLTIEYYTHRRLEMETVNKLNNLFEKLNISKAEWLERFGEREVLLYALITILTLGLFQIYWFYAVTKDQNEHFDIHIKFEEDVIRSLEKI